MRSPAAPSSRTSLSGGSATAKFAYPGRRFAGSVSNSARVEGDGGLEVGDAECELDAGHGIASWAQHIDGCRSQNDAALVSTLVNTFGQTAGRHDAATLPVLDQPEVVACCTPLSPQVLGDADAIRSPASSPRSPTRSACDCLSLLATTAERRGLRVRPRRARRQEPAHGQPPPQGAARGRPRHARAARHATSGTPSSPPHSRHSGGALAAADPPFTRCSLAGARRCEVSSACADRSGNADESVDAGPSPRRSSASADRRAVGRGAAVHVPPGRRTRPATQTNVSNHLRVLREAGLIVSEQAGRTPTTGWYLSRSRSCPLGSPTSPRGPGSR